MSTLVPIEREAVAFFEATVTNVRTGEPVDSFQVTTTLGSARPADWRNADILDGLHGVLVGPVPVGQILTAWVRVVSAGGEDLPVKAGRFKGV